MITPVELSLSVPLSPATPHAPRLVFTSVTDDTGFTMAARSRFAAFENAVCASRDIAGPKKRSVSGYDDCTVAPNVALAPLALAVTFCVPPLGPNRQITPPATPLAFVTTLDGVSVPPPTVD